MMKTAKDRRLSAGLWSALLAIAAAAALASCRTLPPVSDPGYQREEMDAREALPFESAMFLAMDPSALPALTREVLSKLPAKQASSIASLLKSSRMIYVAFTPAWDPGAEGDQAWYALLSGKYSSMAIKAGLAGSKDVKRSGDWYELPNGVKIALDRDRHILATNADMRTFLDRLRSPSQRLEKTGDGAHPISQAAERRSGGAIAMALRPGNGLFSILSGAAIETPIEAMTLDVAEADGFESLDLEFDFQSENGAKSFSPAVRFILVAGSRILGLTGPLPELKRKGPAILAQGIRAKPETLAALIFSMAGKAK